MSCDKADASAMPLILFVEDETLIREMVVEALEDAGFLTLTAGDGDAAIFLLEQHGDMVRGLVTDINLDKGMTGWDLARIAREKSNDLPIVYVSGASGHEWASRGVPGSLMISKPFAPAQIVVAISSLMVATNTPA